MDVLLWSLVVLLIVAGIAGTLLPMLPGTALVFAGLLLGAWIDDFTLVSGFTVAVLGVLTLISWAVDYLSGLLGAKKVGATPQAVIGAAIGTLLGIFTGLWGLVFMPLAGAAIGEYIAIRDMVQARRVGVATWIGMMVGAVLKIAITFLMIGVFVGALLI